LLDLAHAQAAGVVADDGLVEAVEMALVLGDEGGFEAARTVAGYADGQLAVPGAEGLVAVAVARVGLPFGRLAVLLVAEMGGHLAFKDAVDEALLQLGEEPVGAEQIARPAVVLQQLVEQLVFDVRFHGWSLVESEAHPSNHLHKIYFTS
jgi:hypothetical protein